MIQFSIIELVGIAGSGKTTLRRTLQEKNKNIQFRTPPPKKNYAPFVIKHLATWVPEYLTCHHFGRWFTRKEIKLMGYLETWLPYLREQVIANNSIIVLDPGSVYWLTALREFGPEFCKEPRFAKWWNEKLRQWAAALTLIVWLDASEDISYERVLARGEWHEAKEQKKDEALEIFRRLRAGYGETLAGMEAHGFPTILRFCSERTSPEDIANRVFSILEKYEF